MTYQKTPFYSQALSDPALRQIVGALESGTHEGFRTKIFGDADNMTKWMEGWRNPLTGKWTLTHFLEAQSINHVEEEIISASLCFFDALHYAAAFEATTTGLPAVEPAAPRYPHLRDVARDRKIPFDTSGMPHPAAFGNILTSGSFTREERDLARSAGPVRMAEETPSVALSLTDRFLTAHCEEPDVEALGKTRSMSRNILYHEFRKAHNAMASLESLFKEAISYDFYINEYKTHISFAVPILGQLMMYEYLIGVKRNELELSRSQAINFHCKNLLTCAVSLPLPEKALITSFEKAARTAFWMESAATRIKLHKKGKIGALFLRGGVRDIKKASESAGWSKDEVAAVIHKYKNGTFPQSGQLFSALEPDAFEINKRLESYKAKLS